MDSDSWNHLSSSSTSRRSIRPPFDMYLGYEEADLEQEEFKLDIIPCPFCGLEMDTMDLCFHIDDEHPVQAKNGICPICVARVGMDIVGHIRRRSRRSNLYGSYSTISLARKDLRDINIREVDSLQSLIGNGSSARPDPLLSSFVSKLLPPAPVDDTNDASISVQDVHGQLNRDDVAQISLEDKHLQSTQPLVPKEDLEERTQRARFVQELVLSTIADDIDTL
ncbi:protein DEHYDRATION-INDUCED 19 2-like protein [Carex littledalei]|uniref:Protein DEHYDRATION-INDUCED 19 2-like protein n=1 Tax=Carex littledalei TaxID=544730 RepID=A0A833R3B5_9POAL|nr:protein DEHYDRATION-INDUCED 19 2-like protein [Carex littledalei]